MAFPPNAIPSILFLFLTVSSVANCRDIALKSRVKLHKVTGETNPKLDHIPFDPIIAEAEEKMDDEAWERDYFHNYEEEMNRMRKHMEDHQATHGRIHVDPDVAAKWALNHEFRQHRMRQHHPNLDKAEIDVPDDDHQKHPRRFHNFNQEHEEIHHGDHDDEDDNGDEHEELLQDDGFDVASRITQIFPLIDVNPKDDHVSKEELFTWLDTRAKEMSFHRSDREMQMMDSNKDGFVTIKEYFHDDSPGDQLVAEIPNDPTDWRYTSYEQFKVADKDGDKKLDRNEFNEFSHPQDSDNPLLHKWLRIQEIRLRDQNNDSRLSFDEFMESLYEDSLDYEEKQHMTMNAHMGVDTDHEELQRKGRNRFNSFDTNKDGYLTEDEMEALMHLLLPGERHFAKEQAKTIMEQADSNNDGMLHLYEMLDHPDAFYDVAHNEMEFHDEL